MAPLRPGIRRLFRLTDFRWRDAARDVDDEMRLHVELRAAQLMSEGSSEATARAEALRLFAQEAGTVRALYSTARERNQVMRMRERWEALLQDARYAVRGLARDPLPSFFIVLTLGLAVGANVTAFNLVDRLLLRDPAHITQPSNPGTDIRHRDGAGHGRAHVVVDPLPRVSRPA